MAEAVGSNPITSTWFDPIRTAPPRGLFVGACVGMSVERVESLPERRQELTEYALDSGEPAVAKQLFAFPADRCRKIAGLEGLEVPVEGGGRLSDRRSHDAELGAQTGFVLSCCARASRAARSKKLRSL